MPIPKMQMAQSEGIPHKNKHKKIQMSDLPAMGQKTIEASLKKLKEVGLIETTIVEVTQN